MMEVKLWDLKLSCAGNTHEMELIKRINNMEMYKDLDFDGFIVIDGKSYRHCMYDRNKDVLCVEPVNLNEQGEEVEYDDFACPYCGNVNDEAFELSEDEGETECGACGSLLEYERVVTVEYNIRPKKCAAITRV